MTNFLILLSIRRIWSLWYRVARWRIISARNRYQTQDYNLFTKFTFLFTIKIAQIEKCQSKFGKSILKDMKHMKKVIYVLILPLVVLSGLVFANREIKNETGRSPKSLSIAERKARLDGRKKWEASPDGIRYKEWEVSPEGKKVHASHDKISKYIKAFANMEAVVTSTTFQRAIGESSGPKWLIVRINGEEYMMQFIPKDFEQLNSLKVNDKIIIRSHSAGYSPNHPYLIVSGDYIERNNKVLFKRDFSKVDNC
jgi:hypothetical protein